MWLALQSTVRTKSSHSIDLDFFFFLAFRRYIRTFHAYTRRRIHAMVKSQTFYWIVIALVLMNTVVLASEYYGQPEKLTAAQSQQEIFFL